MAGPSRRRYLLRHLICDRNHLRNRWLRVLRVVRWTSNRLVILTMVRVILTSLILVVGRRRYVSPQVLHDGNLITCFQDLNIAFPEVKISALTETGRAESSIGVPLQRSYTGRNPVIPSSLADTPCATLSISGVLDELNATLRTAYTLNTPSLPSILEDCVEKKYNFGTAYGRLRRIWYTDDWSNIRNELRRREEEDREMRRKALEGNRIVKPNLPPRRVWDLYSNRVVPSAWTVGDVDDLWDLLQPISHAWVDEHIAWM